MNPLQRRQKVRKLAQIEGCETVTELLERAAMDSISPAICTEEGCDYTCEMEPDQDRGYCEECNKNTM